MTPIYTEARKRAESLQGGPMTDDVILNPHQEIWLFKPVAEADSDGQSLIAVSETDVWQIGSAPDALELIGAEMPLDDDAEAGIAALIAGISTPEEVG